MDIQQQAHHITNQCKSKSTHQFTVKKIYLLYILFSLNIIYQSTIIFFFYLSKKSSFKNGYTSNVTFLRDHFYPPIFPSWHLNSGPFLTIYYTYTLI